MDLSPEENAQELAETAYAVGQLVARVQDFGLVTANVAIGYRDAQLATGEDHAHSPAYTGASQIGPTPAAAVEPNFSDDQGEGRRAKIEHWQSVLSALQGLNQAVAEEIDCAAREARREGVTWNAIGAALGLTKQTAHQRYGRASDMGDDTP